MSQRTPIDIDTGTITRRLRALPAGTRRNVLIVDDDEIERALIADRLVIRGFEVAHAENGKEALDVLHAERQPVVIVDWFMPVMNGIEFTEEVRARGFDETFILMLTSRSTGLDYERGYVAGVDDYLTKKVSDVELLARIHIAFAMHSLRLQLHEAHRELDVLRGRALPDERNA